MEAGCKKAAGFFLQSIPFLNRTFFF